MVLSVKVLQLKTISCFLFCFNNMKQIQILMNAHLEIISVKCQVNAQIYLEVTLVFATMVNRVVQLIVQVNQQKNYQNFVYTFQTILKVIDIHLHIHCFDIQFQIYNYIFIALCYITANKMEKVQALQTYCYRLLLYIQNKLLIPFFLII